jgi:ribose transport system substrate-binding protein
MKKVLSLILIVASMSVLVSCGAKEETTASAAAETATVEQEKKVYYYVAGFHSHPYFLDMHLGFRYAAEKFNVEIKKMGPDGWDAKAQAEALETAVAMKPDGIITVMWDASGKPAVKRAMESGIPVIVVEATVPDSGAMTYIGLDNYDCGVETAQEIIARGGNSGKLVAQGNWGASNTDSKFQGLKDYLEANSDWEIVAKVDDKANTEVAIEAAKSIFNNYPDVTAIAGLDSSSGSGIGIAMEELNIDPDGYTIVVHDREDMTLEYIEKGFIDSTLINKTATSAYLAIMLLEAWNNSNMGFADLPISGDNKDAGANPFPKYMYNGGIIIDKDNVDKFMAENIPQYKTDLYN